jgi:hypothetical protein
MELIRKLVLLMVVLGTSIANAVPITYTFTGTATGTIGATSFSNATLTISVTLDTSNVTNSPSFFQNPYAANTATFSIGGVGSGTLSNSGAISLNQSAFGGIVEMYDNSLHDYIIEVDGNSIGSTALTGYALKTAIGPVGPQTGNQANLTNVATSRGNLTVGLFNINNLTFQATISAVPATPIPSSFYLCVAGLAAMSIHAAARRRRGMKERACS